MALFDYYNDSDTYAPDGGLIGRLMQLTGAQSAYAPSAGFPQPQQPTNPLSIGGYQMPRIGNSDSFIPEQAMTPPAAMPAQGQMLPQQAPQFAPPNSPGGFGGFFRGAAANMQGGPLGALMGGIGGAMGMGQGTEQDQARFYQQQQYQSLVPILGESKARLAVLNPEIGKAMVAQALAGKQYAFTTAPDGTVIRTDAHAGTAEPVYQGGLKPTFGVVSENDGQKVYGWTDPSKRTVTPYQAPGATEDKGVMGPDGKLIPYPEGVDRKTFRNEISKINADAAGGKKTEVQAKSEKFGNQMELAERNIKGLENEYTSTLGKGGLFRGTEYVPGGNALQSESYQKYRQARDSFLTALLRDESGAAIGSSEFNRREKEMFPQPGDGPEVVKRKAKLRAVAIEGMKKAAGPGYKSPDFEAEDAVKSDIDALLKKYGGK